MEQNLHFIYTDELMLWTCADTHTGRTGQGTGQDTGQDTGTSAGAGAVQAEENQIRQACRRSWLRVGAVAHRTLLWHHCYGGGFAGVLRSG